MLIAWDCQIIFIVQATGPKGFLIINKESILIHYICQSFLVSEMRQMPKSLHYLLGFNYGLENCLSRKKN
jgi:hypothetical protein